MIPSITAAIAAILGLRRTCPKCGEHQIVPREQKLETVNCKYCGAPVPPPRKKS